MQHSSEFKYIFFAVVVLSKIETQIVVIYLDFVVDNSIPFINKEKDLHY